jgi:diguanylate cyclase (GGDEF)-like protein/PAS domain S-box-containing protein
VIGRQIGQFVRRTQAEEDLRRFRAALDASVDLILLVDPVTLRYIDVNDAAVRALGYTRDEFLAMGPHDAFSISREALGELYQRLIEGDQTAEKGEGWYRRKDGSRFLVESFRRALPSAEGHIIVAVARDITEQRKREEELRRFRLALDNSADMIVLIDRATMSFVDVNKTACKLLGYSREELLEMGPQDVLPMSREELERSYDTLIATPSANTGVLISGMRSHYRRKDGTLLPFESTRRVLRSGDGYIIAAISRDIRDRLASEAALKGSNERFDIAVRATNDAIWDWDLATDEVWWNENFAKVFGVPRETGALSRRFWEEGIHPDDRDRVVGGVRGVIESGVVDWSDQYRMRRGDGSYAHVLDRGHVIRDPAGRAVRMIGALADITARKQAEEKMRSQALQQRLVAELGQQALASTDLREVLNRAVKLVSETLKTEYCAVLEIDSDGERLTYKAAFGWPGEWVGRRTVSRGPGSHAEYTLSRGEALVIEDHREDARFTAPEVLLEFGIRSSMRAPMLGTQGAFGILVVHTAHLRRFTEEEVSFLRNVANILAVAIERRKSEEQLAYLAQFDSLTSLPNRHLFHDRLAQTMAQARRSGRPLAVLFIDLDRFKLVNDTLGHGAGDELLKEVAARLSQCVRSGDTVGRFGGDEFGAVLSELGKPGDASTVAQKIIDALARPFSLDGNQTYVSASIGITLFPADGEEAGALIMNADTAMYRAKEQGRDNYQYFTREMNERAVLRVQTEAALRRAIERKEFLLHYQPKVDLGSGAICGLEALLRWQHPSKGLVSPLEFIPVLEDSGLIVRVGEWVMWEACAQIKAWRKAGLSDLPVAINLSARQFQQKDLEATVRGILSETGVDSSLIQFELTESMLMKDPEAAARTLRGLEESGVKISVDDFGTGYSSLAYLKRFPIDSLKIDRAFIRDITTDPEDAAIALAIIGLAHSLKLKVVAEGVETEDQLEFLTSHACDEMQGYYFAKPAAPAEIEAMLREGRRLRRGRAAVGAMQA